MFISYLAIPLMILSSVPQIIKLVNTKNSTGVSLNMFYLTFISVCLLLLEALRIENTILIIADISSLTMLAINIVLIKKYGK
jgi:uncharacterized protein with PQ loop repeat|tara:strand:+ start:1048 stop:1293 length:246 start_codon:yes stop_codon:yes gene_type:complete